MLNTCLSLAVITMMVLHDITTSILCCSHTCNGPAQPVPSHSLQNIVYIHQQQPANELLTL